MRRNKLEELLKQRPGYEAVYLLMQSDCQRKELAEYTNRDGGTLERWLKEAEHAGLVEKSAVLCDGDFQIQYSLACPIPDDLQEIIRDRGGHGPRDQRKSFANTASFHNWNDRHSFNSE